MSIKLTHEQQRWRENDKTNTNNQKWKKNMVSQQTSLVWVIFYMKEQLTPPQKNMQMNLILQTITNGGKSG